MTRKEKWIIVILILIPILLIGGCTYFFNFRGAGWERYKKDFQSNYNGGLERQVSVYSYTGELIKTYEGKFDISEQSNEVKFDMDDGRRVIVRGGIVISEELAEEEKNE